MCGLDEIEANSAATWPHIKLLANISGTATTNTHKNTIATATRSLRRSNSEICDRKRAFVLNHLLGNERQNLRENQTPNRV